MVQNGFDIYYSVRAEDILVVSVNIKISIDIFGV